MKYLIFAAIIFAIVGYRVISGKPLYIPNATLTVLGYEIIRGN